MAKSNKPRFSGEFLIAVAVSNHITKRTAPAIKKSELRFRNAGNGRSRAIIFLDNEAITPIGHKEHQNRAQNKAPMISIGQPIDQAINAAGFFNGSCGPKNRNTSIIKKNGTAALWRTAGYNGLRKALLMKLSRNKLNFHLSSTRFRSK